MKKEMVMSIRYVFTIQVMAEIGFLYNEGKTQLCLSEWIGVNTALLRLHLLQSHHLQTGEVIYVHGEWLTSDKETNWYHGKAAERGATKR